MARNVLKTAGKFALVLLLVVLAYLASVALWSRAAVEPALAQYPSLPSDTNLSKRQVDILLTVEDPTFFTHHGLSLASGQGFTTITSVVAREVLLSHAHLDGAQGALQSVYRGVFACCKKIDLGRDVMALVLNPRLTKRQQLALYVSQLYMGTDKGRQIYGLGPASLAYLGKPLAQLSDKEFITLVAMIKAPNHFHPIKNPAALALRAARIDALVSGRCKAAGWFDTGYEQCTP